jgi:hypothetical protein
MGLIRLLRGGCGRGRVSCSSLFACELCLGVVVSAMLSLWVDGWTRGFDWLTWFFCLAAFEIVIPEEGFCHYKEGM